MMQWWADYLDDMRTLGKVVPLFSRVGAATSNKIVAGIFMPAVWTQSTE